MFTISDSTLYMPAFGVRPSLAVEYKSTPSGIPIRYDIRDDTKVMKKVSAIAVVYRDKSIAINIIPPPSMSLHFHPSIL